MLVQVVEKKEEGEEEEEETTSVFPMALLFSERKNSRKNRSC